jgi:uncharacterized damage-inducible protein DinB
VDSEIGALFLDRCRYYLGTEYPTKLRSAIEAIPSDRLWWRPNDQSNSAGNLLLHLAGNVRQWIVCGVGGAPDARDRASEFSARTGADAGELLTKLEAVLSETDRVLGALTPATLRESRRIQGRDLTVLDAILHVVEHFSLHLGQIVLIAKSYAPGAIQFYEDAGGLAVPRWTDLIRKP